MDSSLDLNNCELEPIRIPGSIQPAGMLFCLDEKEHRIVQISENATLHIGARAEDLLGKRFLDIVRPADKSALINYLATEPGKSGAVTLTFGSDEYTAEAYSQSGLVILEMEPAHSAALDPVAMAKLLSGPVDSMEQATDVSQVMELTVQQVQKHTGYDRVMLYRFDAEWNGEVVAEKLSGDLSPYLHQRFPASDIPRQARELYTKNWIRIIPDVSYAPVPLVPQINPSTNAQLDLSFSVFRSVSPVHVEYLHNMRVGASMSISIIVRGQLWGLIACHNKTPKLVPHDVRATCKMFGKLLSVRLSALQEQEANKVLHQQAGVMSLVRNAVGSNETVAAGVQAAGDTIMQVIDADDLLVISDDEIRQVGQTELSATTLASLRKFIESHQSNVFTSSQAAADVPVTLPADVCGLCSIHISSPQKLLLIGLRQEVVQNITWSGDPTKPMHATEGQPDRLHPRKSFEAYVQIVIGQSSPWKEHQVAFLRQLSEVLGDAITQREYRRSADALSISQERDDVVSGLAHDLKAPLIAAIKTSQALAGGRFGAIDGLPKEMIKLIIESQQELLGRLEGMLSVYRQEVLGISMLSRPQQVSALVETAMRRLNFSMVAKQITPSVKADPSVLVLGDQDALLRVVENLLSNAIKFSPERTTISVTCRAEDGQALLTVTDCGPGIADGDRHNLFTRFSPVNNGKSQDSSHGLGLYLTKRIVEAHGGKVVCSTHDGDGATFEVTLPLFTEETSSARIAG